MKKIFRLRQGEISTLFRRSAQLEFRSFRVRARKNFLSHARFALVVPKSVDKRSTARNRLRRMAREWIRKNRVVPAKSLDVVLTFKKEAAASSGQEFYAELSSIFDELNRRF